MAARNDLKKGHYITNLVKVYFFLNLFGLADFSHGKLLIWKASIFTNISYETHDPYLDTPLNSSKKSERAANTFVPPQNEGWNTLFGACSDLDAVQCSAVHCTALHCTADNWCYSAPTDWHNSI